MTKYQHEQRLNEIRKLLYKAKRALYFAKLYDQNNAIDYWRLTVDEYENTLKVLKGELL